MITIGVLIVLVLLTPLLVISMLVLSVPSPLPNTLGQLPLPSPGAATVGKAGTATGTNASSLCANATKYIGLGSADPSPTNVSLSFGIFSMQPGSQAYVCIKFYNHDNVRPVNLDLGDIASIGNYQTHTFTNGTTQLKFASAAPNVTITPVTATVFLSGANLVSAPGAAGGTLAPNKEVVAFRIDARPDSRGTYYLNVHGLAPDGCTGEFRIAIGLRFTDSNASGPYFALPPNVGACSSGSGVVHDHVYGVRGMEITYLSCDLYICDVNRPGG